MTSYFVKLGCRKGETGGRKTNYDLYNFSANTVQKRSLKRWIGMYQKMNRVARRIYCESRDFPFPFPFSFY
ncbi:hypothetical protein COM90_22780 [Bacillus thuringiensis]|uniref:Transposase n=1 Tax=Bacillus thuringiensis TaxID=1428 RepID=A0AB36TLI1_BACTU|nr:hypothetical protein COM74_09820 [Bacillus thuringiensis]PEE86546.1 hypothetical protein COM90_22780 [Bacillus thuringiensis]PFM84357.1 hypothetical protein COJ61_30035 [Bacillus thuringiensis]